jgi:hypothetical protein
VYDVFYNQFEDESKAGKGKEVKKNRIQIDVNYDQLKKYIPNLNAQSAKDLSKITRQLLEGVRVDEDGKITVDSSKINPNIL